MTADAYTSSQLTCPQLLGQVLKDLEFVQHATQILYRIAAPFQVQRAKSVRELAGSSECSRRPGGGEQSVYALLIQGDAA